MHITKFGLTVTKAMQDVFNAADEKPVDWALTLAQNGLADRQTARPFVVIWAGEKYGERVTNGKRGIMVPHQSNASRAVDRVLKAVFSADDRPKAKAKAKSSGSVEIARGIKTALKPVLAQFSKAEIQAYLKTL